MGSFHPFFVTTTCVLFQIYLLELFIYPNVESSYNQTCHSGIDSSHSILMETDKHSRPLYCLICKITVVIFFIHLDAKLAHYNIISLGSLVNIRNHFCVIMKPIRFPTANCAVAPGFTFASSVCLQNTRGRF